MEFFKITVDNKFVLKVGMSVPTREAEALKTMSPTEPILLITSLQNMK